MTEKDLTVTIMTTVLAAIGWLVVYVLNSLREDRIKRLQATIDRSAEQIKEFYAPLITLTDQLDSLATVRDATVERNPGDTKKIDELFFDNYFIPVHDEIKSILSSKVYLMEGDDLPVSFKLYFEHVAAERAIRKMSLDGFDVTGISAPPFPSNFYWDVRRGFKNVSARYEDSLREIRIPWLGFPIAIRRRQESRPAESEETISN